MCGIFGMIQGPNVPMALNKSKDFMHDAAIVGILRGTHSMGVLQVDRKNAFFAAKKATHGWNALNDKRIGGIIDDTGACRVTIGHHRAATRGSGDEDDNAHPFWYGDWEKKGVNFVGGVHNGTLNEAIGKFSVDSDYLYHSLEAAGDNWKQVLSNMMGTYALAFYRKSPEGARTVHLVTAENGNRPLHFAFVKHMDALVLTSERLMVAWLAERNNIEIADDVVYRCEPGMVYTFDLEKPVRAFTKEKLPAREWSKSTSDKGNYRDYEDEEYLTRWGGYGTGARHSSGTGPVSPTRFVGGNDKGKKEERSPDNSAGTCQARAVLASQQITLPTSVTFIPVKDGGKNGLFPVEEKTIWGFAKLDDDKQTCLPAKITNVGQPMYDLIRNSEQCTCDVLYARVVEGPTVGALEQGDVLLLLDYPSSTSRGKEEPKAASGSVREVSGGFNVGDRSITLRVVEQTAAGQVTGYNVYWCDKAGKSGHFVMNSNRINGDGLVLLRVEGMWRRMHITEESSSKKEVPPAQAVMTAAVKTLQ